MREMTREMTSSESSSTHALISTGCQCQRCTHCTECGKRYAHISVNASDYRVTYYSAGRQAHMCAACWRQGPSRTATRTAASVSLDAAARELGRRVGGI